MNPVPHQSAKYRILWIEDDLRYARLLELELGDRFEFDVYSQWTPAALSALAIAGSEPDAVIIDLHLQGERQGSNDYARVRELGFRGPVFVLSNDETAVSKLEMLALGVDDYLWKVMPTEELALRIVNAIQRYQRSKPASGGQVRESADSHRVELGGFEINLDRLTASLHGENVDLSKIEFRIFLTLFRNHPQPTAVTELKSSVWGGDGYVEPGTISTFTWKLNKKLKGWKYRIVKSGEEVQLLIVET